jgi:hypothetical protein
MLVEQRKPLKFMTKRKLVIGLVAVIIVLASVTALFIHS